MSRCSVVMRSVLACAVCCVALAAGAEEPMLPSGLGGNEPGLPQGLGGVEPGLPQGLGLEGSDPEDQQKGDKSDVWESDSATIAQQMGITGFTEVRLGTRTRDPIDQRHTSLAELRLELEKEVQWGSWNGKLTVDLLYDDIADSQHVDLETGEGWLDAREAWIQRRLGQSIDLKLGRQVLTWGVGDLLFINDLFPKDWKSFLAGRDEQYLKAPSDALRIGFYSDVANVNLVYTPRFDSDRYIDGGGLSYYDPNSGAIVGVHHPVVTDKPKQSFEDGELALRIYRQVFSFELALYGYHGYWKSPAGFDPVEAKATFPPLRIYGASVRGPLGPGIFSGEVGYYDSYRDSDGDNPLINNSEWRALVGYEWEVANETTLGLQYYVEMLQDYSAYRRSLSPIQPARDENRQLLTARVTRLAMRQNLTASLFVFYSPSDHDFYWRPKVSYKVTDNWLVEGGMNLFEGRDMHTFFGQFESNSNLYAAVRCSF